jgi:hypothetical protein
VIVIIDPSADVRDQLAALIHHEEEVVRASTLAEAETTLQHVRRDVRLVVLGPGLAASEVLSFAEKVDHQREGSAPSSSRRRSRPGCSAKPCGPASPTC